MSKVLLQAILGSLSKFLDSSLDQPDFLFALHLLKQRTANSTMNHQDVDKQKKQEQLLSHQCNPIWKDDGNACNANVADQWLALRCGTISAKALAYGKISGHLKNWGLKISPQEEDGLHTTGYTLFFGGLVNQTNTARAKEFIKVKKQDRVCGETGLLPRIPRITERKHHSLTLWCWLFCRRGKVLRFSCHKVRKFDARTTRFPVNNDCIRNIVIYQTDRYLFRAPYNIEKINVSVSPTTVL